MADRWIYRDALGKGWQEEGSNDIGVVVLTQRGIVYAGEVAGAFQVKVESGGVWKVNFLPDAPVHTLGFAALRFAFHPGDTEKRFSNILAAKAGDRSWDLVRGEYKVDLESRDWQVIELPLEDVQPLESIEFAGNIEGTFYLDEMRLVAATPPLITAVTDERTATLPQSFLLEQNYPNPFNSSTTIRLDLPRSEEIDLAAYNLTGQKVATLARGHREAGTFALRWDGRDDDGSELASGVYLYRLTAGDRAETRKLLLLR